MTDQNENREKTVIKRASPFFLIVSFYFLGFFITQKSDFDSTTGLGIAMLIFGWLCMLVSMFLCVRILVAVFKEQFKKK